MKIEEIRIGNLVYDTKGEVNTVCVETFVKFNHQIKPIELTEEWLANLGFEKQGLNKFWLDPILLTYYVDGVLYLANQRHVNIHYVHQLQNLYFALTGQELTPE